jgi:hypothetical protein
MVTINDSNIVFIFIISILFPNWYHFEYDFKTFEAYDLSVITSNITSLKLTFFYIFTENTYFSIFYDFEALKK